MSDLYTDLIVPAMASLKPGLLSLLDSPKKFRRFSPDELAEAWLIFGCARSEDLVINKRYPKFESAIARHFKSLFHLYGTQTIHYRIYDGYLLLTLEKAGRRTHILGGFTEEIFGLITAILPRGNYPTFGEEIYEREKLRLARIGHSLSTEFFRRLWEHEGSAWLG